MHEAEICIYFNKMIQHSNALYLLDFVIYTY